MKRILIISLLIAAFGCTKTDRPKQSEGTPMMMNAITKSPTDFGAGAPVFIFWLDTDFAAIASDNYTQPYLAAWPLLGIDSYAPSVRTYDTGREYPSDDRTVCCTGYFPATLVIDDGADRRSWTKLTIPEEDVATLDVMVAPEHITGKASEHFDTKSPEEPLVFIHAQSKVSFKAKMGTDMAQNRYLRNIKVTIPGKEQFMTGLKWENGRYVADGIQTDDSRSIVLTDQNSTQLDPTQKPRDLGHVYLYPGKSSIRIKVEVEMDDSPLFQKPEIISVDTDVPFTFADSIGQVLRENDRYEIILTINYDSIAIIGRKAEWEDGGELVIPIYPNR